MYYKIKKKKEQSKLGEVSPDGDSKSSPPKETKEVPQESPSNANQKEGDNSWGAHLNKVKATAESPRTPSASSPCLNYSKLTEKLMKGAKINTRSSLSKRLSINKLSGSPRVTNNCSQPGTPNKSPLNEDSNSSFVITPETSSSFIFNAPEHSQTPQEPDQALDVIKGFKPKIIHKKTVRKNFSVQSAAASDQALKAPSRTVDLGWLNDCMSEDNPTASKPNDDEDIIYSSEDEGRKSKRKSILKPPKVPSPAKTTNETRHDQDYFVTPVQVVSKRKFDEEEENIAPNVNKKHKVENSGDQDDTEIGMPKPPPPPNEDCYEFNDGPVKSTRKAATTQENATITAKRERLAKY